MNNQTLTVTMYGQEMRVEHKTMMCSLPDIFKIGNELRKRSGRSEAEIQAYLKTERTKDFISATEEAWGLESGCAVQVVGKGRYTRTMVHLSVAIHAAEYLSPEFHAAVIKEFIEGRLLQYRDESGEEFKALNMAIDKIPERVGKNNVGLYINCAKMMKEKIKPNGDSWNTATADQLRMRTKIESFVLDSIEFGSVQTYDEMFRLIQSYKFRAMARS